MSLRRTGCPAVAHRTLPDFETDSASLGYRRAPYFLTSLPLRPFIFAPTYSALDRGGAYPGPRHVGTAPRFRSSFGRPALTSVVLIVAFGAEVGWLMAEPRPFINRLAASSRCSGLHGPRRLG